MKHDILWVVHDRIPCTQSPGHVCAKWYMIHRVTDVDAGRGCKDPIKFLGSVKAFSE